MEWGARALGNRSILADPRRRDMRDIINQKIKFRERFRPFAPSMLAESIDDYFVGAVHDPFMIQVYPVRPDKRDVIPAVTHVDGSGRLQSVSRESNPRYWALISAFDDADRRAGAAEHVVQRERADRRASRAGARLLPAHRHGCARDGPAPAAQTAMTTATGAPAARVLLQPLVLARHRRHRPAADRARRGSGRRRTACEVTVVTGYPLTATPAAVAASELRNGVRIMRARGTTVVAALVRRTRHQLRDLFPVGAVDRAAAAATGRDGGADRSADHRPGGARRAAAPRHGVLLPGHLSGSRGAARGLSQPDFINDAARTPESLPGSARARASSRSATRWRRGWSHGKGADPAKITVIHNWADTLGDRAVGEGQRVLAARTDSIDRFVVLHAGNIGLSQNLDVVIDAAEIAAGRAPTS